MHSDFTFLWYIVWGLLFSGHSVVVVVVVAAEEEEEEEAGAKMVQYQWNAVSTLQGLPSLH